ncbi:MAG: hypothetical protein LBC56_08510 [Oscillospiraceae bacterium]|jgi:hypothetical protein|nr:hypothetical protein [Oscillospiraceae bacterium]
MAYAREFKKNQKVRFFIINIIDAKELELINQYSLSPLAAEEVFSFNVTLCDNEIDRDFERFDLDALQKLQTLFLGKPGIFDHNPKAESQTARIYSAEVVPDVKRVTGAGETYYALKAKAYMLKSEKNADLIRELEGGIKKEVSVSCSVEKEICSVCGADWKKGGCSHIAGKIENGRLCHRILQNPLDAYEWSFVAIPAQREAGVTKIYLKTNPGGQPELDGGYLRRLEKEAAYGRAYHAELVRDIVKLGFFRNAGMPSDVLEAIAQKLDIEELKALKGAFGHDGAFAPPATALIKAEEITDNKAFLI